MDSDVNTWLPIPGETPIDPSGLKDRSIKTRSELNKVEAENIRKVFVKYLPSKPTKKSAPFTYDWLLRLHHEMFHEVWIWAGELRTRELNMGVPWRNIQEQLWALLTDLNEWNKSQGMSLVERSARLHYRAVWVHPFENGNGRWSRMLASIWLRQNAGPLLAWPDEHIEKKSVIREEYLATLHDADYGDFLPLVKLHEKYAK